MKVNVRYGAVAFLFVVACNRPDADLFGADGSPPDDSNSDGGTLAVTPVTTAGTGAATAGGTASGEGADAGTTSGGTADRPATGGDSATGGSSVAGGASGGVGGSSLPDQAGSASGGAGTAGTTGTPEPPKPICGNGTLEAGEACDDAGHAGKDGCDANCKVVCADYGAGTLESEDHHCYNGYDQGDFETAQAACVKKGAHLASISSAAENQLARKLVNGSKWLGGYEDVPLTSEGTGKYTWLTGEALTYTNWAEKEPNRRESHCGVSFNTTCFEHCISILGDGTWADARCDLPDGYVCEWEPAGKK